MQGSLDTPPIIVRSRRWSLLRARSLIAVPAAVIVLFSLAVQPGGPPLWGYPFMALVALGLVNIGWIIISPTRLVIDQGGISRQITWRKRRWTWAEAAHFRTVRYMGVDCIGFDHVGPNAAKGAKPSITSNITGADVILISNPEIDAESLGELLNHARERWFGALSATTQPVSPTPITAGLWTRVFTFLISARNGRISRKAYLTGLAVIAVPAIVMGAVLGDAAYGAVFGYLVASFLVGGRLRDFGFSAILRWMLLPAIGVVAAVAAALVRSAYGVEMIVEVGAVVMLAALGLPPGDAGPNRFGPPPGTTRDSRALGVGQVFD